jgi:asparagine synthase (glutamine-hydrolysing)
MHPNMSPTFVHVPEGSSLFGVHEAMWELGAGPAANPANTLWMHAVRARAASMGITSLLTGDFGNLFFSADGPDWLASLLRAGRMRDAMREAARWRESTGDGWYRVLRGQLAGPLVPPALARLARRARRADDRLQEWMTASALRPELVAGLDLPALLPQVDEGRWRDRRDVAVAVRGHYAGQADVAHALWATTGVEARDPTADRRVLEVAMKQPEWARRSNGTTRAVARVAMADRLPVSIVRRTRRGEQLPEWLDLMTAARPEITAELDRVEAHATSRELIDVGRLRALVARWPERSTSGDAEVVRDYRLALFRSLLVSRYLRWFESRAVTG